MPACSTSPGPRCRDSSATCRCRDGPRALNPHPDARRHVDDGVLGAASRWTHLGAVDAHLVHQSVTGGSGPGNLPALRHTTYEIPFMLWIRCVVPRSPG